MPSAAPTNTTTTVRALRKDDAERAAAMRCRLYTSCTLEESRAEVAALASGAARLGGLPWAMLVAEETRADGAAAELVGFAEVSLRSHADDCAFDRPAGFLEGWWVEDSRRRTGVGRLLVLAAFEWARAQGCTEMASDTALSNEVSRRAHAALGFEESAPVVHFRRPL